MTSRSASTSSHVDVVPAAVAATASASPPATATTRLLLWASTLRSTCSQALQPGAVKSRIVSPDSSRRLSSATTAAVRSGSAKDGAASPTLSGREPGSACLELVDPPQGAPVAAEELEPEPGLGSNEDCRHGGELGHAGLRDGSPRDYDGERRERAGADEGGNADGRGAQPGRSSGSRATRGGPRCARSPRRRRGAGRTT